MTNPAILTKHAHNALRTLRSYFAPAATHGIAEARQFCRLIDDATGKLNAAEFATGEHLERAREYLINIRTQSEHLRPGDIADLAEAALRELDAAQGQRRCGDDDEYQRIYYSLHGDHVRHMDRAATVRGGVYHGTLRYDYCMDRALCRLGANGAVYWL